ncbi:uncharacterized protein AB675_6220 [Cyphellophora attinorum]|uniref:Uncharacterized protein n=1 Tax=Cyphellophora attinorum TaxID=1664694 RepID=A0A0N0NQX5_9EURO|nr:uncharacterized protein AB675_6220 [Phialophora attinorum]KPI44179.1 hypothetical protein AB675_6220 [Phialophora attinorum]
MAAPRKKFSTGLPGLGSSNSVADTTPGGGLSGPPVGTKQKAEKTMAPPGKPKLGVPPPPVPPQKSMLRGRPLAYGLLDSVEEETASIDGKRASTADSVQTVFYRPLGEAGDSDDFSKSSAANEKSSGSGSISRLGGSSDESSKAHTSGSSQERLARDLGCTASGRLNAVKKNSRSTDSRGPPKHVDVSSPSEMHDLLAPPGTEPRYSPSRPGKPVERERQYQDDGAVNSPEEGNANSRILGAAARVRRSNQSLAGSGKHFSRPFQSDTPDHRESSASISGETRPPVRQRYYRSMRDGVPILMHQRSGVWVEAVEGVDLTTFNGNKTTDEDDEPLPVQEAEDVREIELPDRSTIGSASSRPSDGSSGRAGISDDSGYGSSTAQPSADPNDTARWARTQSNLRSMNVGTPFPPTQKGAPPTTEQIPTNIGSKIEQVAADVEEMLYGGLKSKRNRRLDDRTILEQLER